MPDGAAALRLPATTLMVLALVAGACAVGAPAGSPQVTPSPAVTAASSAVPTSGSTSAPGTDITSASTRPTAYPTSSLSAVTGGPPAGVVEAARAQPVTGHLGSYCWDATCSDEFELPTSSTLPDLTVTSAEQSLSFSLSPGIGFVQWSASYTTGKSADLVPLAGGGAAFDPDSTASPPPALFSATFAAPPKGDWTLVVSIHFGPHAGGGDATYAWHAMVR